MEVQRTTAEQILLAAGSLFNAFTFERLIPLVMLFSLSCLFLWVLFKAQQRKDFDASMFLRNDRGMLASERLWAFVCLMVHTWFIATRTLNDKITENDMLIYCVTWSASAVLLAWIENWRGVRTNTPPPDNPLPPPTVHPPSPQPPLQQHPGEESVPLTIPKE